MINIREKENCEAEIVSLKNKLQMKDIAKGYDNSSKVLEQIISNQKSFFDKTGIGYKQNTNEASSSMLTDNEKKPRRYAEVVKDSKNEEEIERQPEQPVLEKGPAERSDHRKAPPPYIPRYGYFFYGHCFTCGRFGHKAVNCFQRRNFETRNNLASLRRPQYNNRFDPLRSEIECYKCNNFGHIARNCRTRIPTVKNEDLPNKVWIKHNNNNYECGTALQAQNHSSGKLMLIVVAPSI